MGLSTARSSFISSSPTSSSKYGSKGGKKRFSCVFPGCGRSFVRSDHLQRHELNHKGGGETCLRCSAHFYRSDLFERHMARHVRMDKAAGGEGLGVLATRKRLRKDSNGKIVNSCRPDRRQISSPERKIFKPSFTTNIPSGDFNIQPRPISSSAAAEQNREPNELDQLFISKPAPLLENPFKPSPINPSEIFEFRASYECSTWPPPYGVSQFALPNAHTTSTSFSPISFLESRTLEFPYLPPSCSPQYIGAIAELPSGYIINPQARSYEWHGWSQFLVSSCREEKA